MNGLVVYVIFLAGVIVGWLLCAAVTNNTTDLPDDEIRRRMDRWTDDPR